MTTTKEHPVYANVPPKISIIAGKAYYVRTKLPANCTLCHKRLSSRNRASAQVGTLPGTYDDLCVSCYEEDPEELPYVPDAHETIAVPTGRKNMSHLDCAHPRTSKARAVCRASR